MFQLTSTLSAFWTVVVVNCMQPVNWKACLPVHQWLLPGLHEAWVVYTNPHSIYLLERNKLKSLEIND
tara:strand:+ start:1166 stop:1369 length:204 start_codon:yes stop_codon:yes gene_type:complete